MSVPLDWQGVAGGWQRAGNQTSLEDEEDRGEEEEGEVSSRYRGPEVCPPTPAEEYRSARAARLLNMQQQEWRLNSARVTQLKAAVQRRVEAAQAQLDVRLQQLRLQEEEELLQLDLRSHSHSAQLTQQQERQQQQRQMALRSVELQLSSQEASLREVGQVSEAKYRETLERKQREEEEARRLKREKEEAQRRAEEELRAQQAAQAAREAEEKARLALQEQRQQQAAAPAEPAGPPAEPDGDTAGTGQPAAGGSKAAAGGLLQGEAGAWLMPKSAVAFEQRCASALQQAQAAVQAVKADAQQQKAARDVSKQITKHINAISSTQRQVQAKAQELSALLHSTSGNSAQLQYAYMQLAARILSQAEMQIASNERSCYPIAEVVVAVIAGGHENLLFVLLGKLHQACPLAIPKFFKERTKLGFELRDEASGTYESEDSFVARLKGYMLLWGALTQSGWMSGASGGRGAVQLPLVDQAWLWLSRFVNHMPVNRFTGIALESFLRTSGYSFAHRFGKQARKLLEVMHNTFGNELQQLCKHKGNADLLPIANRLDAFISKQEFLQPPAGHFDTLPVFDESANFG